MEMSKSPFAGRNFFFFSSNEIQFRRKDENTENHSFPAKKSFFLIVAFFQSPVYLFQGSWRVSAPTFAILKPNGD
jgi:hypothetical protein